MFSSINKSLFERMGPHGATSLNILELLADSTENPICRGPQNSSRTFCDEWETIKPHFQTHPHPSWAGYVWIQDCRFSGGRFLPVNVTAGKTEGKMSITFHNNMLRGWLFECIVTAGVRGIICLWIFSIMVILYCYIKIFGLDMFGLRFYGSPLKYLRTGIQEDVETFQQTFDQIHTVVCVIWLNPLEFGIVIHKPNSTWKFWHKNRSCQFSR